MAGLHAASFRSAGLAACGVRLQLAAIPSWPVFGAALLLVTRDRGRLWEWFDLCLVTLGTGLLVLAAGGLLNVVAPDAWQPRMLALQTADVLLADLAMAVYFTRRAPGLGLRTGLAWLLWLAVLNGAFALAWAALPG